MAATPLTLRLMAQLQAELATVLDQHTRTLVAAWADAWDEVAPDLQAAVLAALASTGAESRRQLMRSTKLASVLQVIASQLQDLTSQAGIVLTGDLQAVIDQAGAAQAAIVASQLPVSQTLVAAAAWSQVDAAAVTAIVERTTEQVTSLLKPVAPETYTVIRRELIRGIAAGSNPKQTAARMVRRAEQRHNFGLTRALVIARTETLDAHRAAAQVAQEQHADVLAGWLWLAKLDGRTCRSCFAQHGQVHDLDQPGPHDHQQGRCARMPVTKSWADLGFDVPEPASKIPDAAEVFASLPAAQQRQILGAAGHDAWKDGKFPMDAWSRKRTTSGWRDSYVVAPAPAAATARAAS